MLAKSGSTRVISIDAYVDGDFLASFIADGLIVSTPTGSTAYSLATGGPVVVPSSGVIIISPISAHTLTARPVIVSGDSRINVCARSDEGRVMVMADGRIEIQDDLSVEVEIARGDHPVSLVKGLGPGYFETLRRKLSAEGISYQQIKDNLRSDLANKLLANRSLTIGEVARQLNFSEPRAFTRAFKQWSGLTPREYRTERLTRSKSTGYTTTLFT